MELIEVTFQTRSTVIYAICSVSGFRPEDNWKWKVKQERFEVKIFRKGIVGGKNLGPKACRWVGLGGKTRGEHSLASSTGPSLPSSQVLFSNFFQTVSTKLHFKLQGILTMLGLYHQSWNMPVKYDGRLEPKSTF